LAGALAVIALGLPIAGAFAIAVATRDAMTDRAMEGELATARAVAAQAGRTLDFAVGLAQAAARRPGLIAFVRDRDLEQVQDVLENLFSADLYRAVGAYDARGRLLASEPRPPRLPAEVGFDRASYVSEPVVEDVDAVLYVREALLGDDRGVVGYVVAEVSFDRTIFGFSSLRFGDTGSLSLVDRTGVVLLTGDPLRRGTTLRAPEVIDLVSPRREGTAQYHAEAIGRDVVAAFVPVEGADWGVLASQDRSEVLADVDAVRRALTIGAVVLVLVGMAVAYLLWRNVTAYEETIDADQRDLEVAARELERTNHEVEAANEMLRDFVAVAAHDLRSPLSVVSGFAELLADSGEGLAPERRAEYIGMIHHQASAMAAIVDDLQTISRLDAGGLEVERLAVSAREAIDSVVGSMETDGEPVSVSCPSDLTVLADPDHLERMLRNYVTNALKYGGPPVVVTAASSGGSVEFRVCDGGPGVPPEFVPRLFEKFARANAPARREQPGTGLGLCIVRGLAEANGGGAWYEPAATGSCFAFRLPEGGPTPPRAPDAGRQPVGAS
jgi:signal transduction histidine kinase